MVVIPYDSKSMQTLEPMVPLLSEHQESLDDVLRPKASNKKIQIRILVLHVFHIGRILSVGLPHAVNFWCVRLSEKGITITAINMGKVIREHVA